MQLTISQVYKAIQALDAIIAERRPMPQIGKFKLARMHAKLFPEFNTANAQRTELIAKHGEIREEDGQMWVPPARMDEFNADWEPIAASVIEVDIEPIRIADLAIDGNGAIEASELLLLGDLVTE